MKEELKNLTPEMVEELRKLGVEFEDTSCVHAYDEEYLGVDTQGEPIYRAAKSYSLYTNCESEFYDIEEAIPAPDLQNVLDKLPKQFNDGENCYCLILDYATNVMYYYDAIKSIYSFNSKNSHSFSLDNPLIAAYELLCYVATNYPENIKGGEK